LVAQKAFGRKWSEHCGDSENRERRDQPQPYGSISLPSLDRPRIKSRLIALAGRASLEHAEIPKDGTLFAYVLDGALQLHFSDGTTEQLGTGDSIHVTERLPIEWVNPLARRSVTLCLADRRGDSAVF
jgi:hypothetical protein